MTSSSSNTCPSNPSNVPVTTTSVGPASSLIAVGFATVNSKIFASSSITIFTSSVTIVIEGQRVRGTTLVSHCVGDFNRAVGRCRYPQASAWTHQTTSPPADPRCYTSARPCRPKPPAAPNRQSVPTMYAGQLVAFAAKENALPPPASLRYIRRGAVLAYAPVSLTSLVSSHPMVISTSPTPSQPESLDDAVLPPHRAAPRYQYFHRYQCARTRPRPSTPSRRRGHHHIGRASIFAHGRSHPQRDSRVLDDEHYRNGEGLRDRGAALVSHPEVTATTSVASVGVPASLRVDASNDKPAGRPGAVGQIASAA